jgi:hypothetical protein
MIRITSLIGKLDYLEFFLLFLIEYFFFQFHPSYWVDWELGFLIYLGLLSMRLFSFHDSGHRFDELIMVD